MTQAAGETPDYDGLDIADLRAKASAKWAGAAPGMICASYAEMDFPLAAPISAALSAQVARSDLGYPGPAAFERLTEAFRGHAREAWGWSPDPARVSVLSDVMQAVALALDTLTAPGATVWTALPAYPPYFQVIAAMGRRLAVSPMHLIAGRWTPPGPDAVASAIGGRNGAILLCNPHNPTGAVLTEDELRAVARFAAARGLVVISDEIHMDLVHAPLRHLPFLPIAREEGADAVMLTSAAKGFNIPGVRCALAIASGAAVHAALQRSPACIRGGVSWPGLTATAAAWESGAAWLGGVRSYLAANRDLIVADLSRRLPGVLEGAPEGGYLAWLDLRGFAPGAADRFMAERANVAVFGGQHFGPGWDGYVRVNFATSRPILETLLARLIEACSRS